MIARQDDRSVTRALVRTSATVALIAVLALAGIAPAGAATSVTTGWWTTAVTPTAPDVPPDGLLVQSTVTPTAFAAVSFQLAEGEQVRSLTLSAAPAAFSNPTTTLRLCPLTAAFEPAQGGAAGDAPAYDCTTAVDASPTNGSYSFDVAALPASGTFAVAVLPTGPLDRVVLAAPELGALTTTSPTTGTTEPVGAPPTTAPAASTGAPATAPGRPAPATPRPTPNLGGGAAPAPSASEPAAGAAVEDAAPPTLPTVAAGAATTSRAAQLGLAAAIAACVALWLASSTFADRRARSDRDSVVAPA